MGSCHYCKTAVSAEVLRRHRLCPQCGSDLHCCRNCIHYAPALATGCRESESPWVPDRSAENGCEWFEFRPTPAASDAGPEHDTTAADRAKEAFRALFRDDR